jgi:catalase
MDDGEHPELDFDPLDDTKLWPREQFPWYPVGKMTLNKNPENYFAEVEQSAFGTGVLVDGLDFSDDKMLQGRTFSYSDTQRYRVGTNYLQLPINAPKNKVLTNQRDGQMTYNQGGEKLINPHVNYEPSTLGGPKEAERPGKEHSPMYQAALVRQKIEKQNNFKQAGETYRNFEDWEKDELILNLVNTLATANKDIQDRMVEMFRQCDEDYGKRVADGLATTAVNMSNKGPIGTTESHNAVVEAEEQSKESKPY